jgi:phthalate 4,5-dioxygenase
MTTLDENERLTRVGPGTPMGRLMREYWMPAMLSSELPNPDCDPVKVMLLGEELIGFRDSSGQPGLVANLCPHRGASLFLGRNEENGLRCLYHGWKFDTEGNCVDMPSEPPNSAYKDRVKVTAYPCQEHGGAIWTYMGPRSVPPQFPRIEALESPDGATTTARMTSANWLQVLEGAIDTVHAAILHRGGSEPDWFTEGSFEYYHLKQRWATLAAADTEGGAIYGAYRPGPEGFNYWRIGKFMFPFWATPAAGYMGGSVGDTAYVPMDDYHTMGFNIGTRSRGAVRAGGSRLPAAEDMKLMQAESDILPNTNDWFGRFKSIYNDENDWLLDRTLQRDLWSFAGMPYRTPCEDEAVQTTMGPILPREIEHLGTSDLMVIRVRRLLLDALRDLEDNKAPSGVDTPDTYLGRVGQVMIPEGADWLEWTADLRRPFVDNGPPDQLLMAGPTEVSKGSRYMRHERSPIF